MEISNSITKKLAIQMELSTSESTHNKSKVKACTIFLIRMSIWVIGKKTNSLVKASMFTLMGKNIKESFQKA